jgi:hypothetical protein
MTNGSVNHVMLFRLAYTVFGFFALVILAVTTVFWYPFVPVKYEKVVLLHDTVSPGEAISYDVYFTKYVEKTGTMTRWLVCKQQSTQVLDFSLADAAITDRVKHSCAEIPKITRPNQECKVTWTVGYDFFGLRTVAVRYETPWFYILPQLSKQDLKGEKGDTGAKGIQGKPGLNFWGK